LPRFFPMVVFNRIILVIPHYSLPGIFSKSCVSLLGETAKSPQSLAKSFTFYRKFWKFYSNYSYKRRAAPVNCQQLPPSTHAFRSCRTQLGMGEGRQNCAHPAKPRPKSYPEMVPTLLVSTCPVNRHSQVCRICLTLSTRIFDGRAYGYKRYMDVLPNRSKCL